MSKLQSVIDRAVTQCTPPNDSALADRLHVSRSAVSLWRKDGPISEKHLTALIAVADIDEAAAVEVLKEQAKTDPQKAVWGAIARRLAATAAGILLLAGFSISNPEKASQFNGLRGDNAHSLYIMSNLRWVAGLLWEWLAWKLRNRRSSPGNKEMFA